jgi:hypothetical protein
MNECKGGGRNLCLTDTFHFILHKRILNTVARLLVQYCGTSLSSDGNYIRLFVHKMKLMVLKGGSRRKRNAESICFKELA